MGKKRRERMSRKIRRMKHVGPLGMPKIKNDRAKENN
jgi:hypothetical protein